MPSGEADLELEIESLDQDGRGVAHDGGKVIFVEGGLTGERVVARPLRSKTSYAIAETITVLRGSATRVTPDCPHFDVCGGCSMQHLDARAQVAVKQRVLENSLWHIGRLKPVMIFRPIHGPYWGYRFRARLSVRRVSKESGVLVGFHEKKSSFIADMTECRVLPPHVSALLVPLRHLVESLSINEKLPQIELAIGEKVTALVLRLLEPLNANDETLVRAFAREHAVQIWLQSKGPDTAYGFEPPARPEARGDDDDALFYRLPEFGVFLPFMPTDFTQVNHGINRVLVQRALALLDPQPHERIADLFSGLGNFSLPIATRAAAVVGIEGSAVLTRRAAENAVANGLGDKTTFHSANLFHATVEQFQALGRFDKMLIDPPRDGALEVVKVIAALGADAPSRIVYVSCNPGSLARDAAILVTQGGYVLRGAGVVNMFPHTSHVESVVWFEKAAGESLP